MNTITIILNCYFWSKTTHDTDINLHDSTSSGLKLVGRTSDDVRTLKRGRKML
jgi:hypothetical protein